jgi:DNA-binding NarL/FixJ family response regulator
MFEDDESVFAAMRAGESGYLVKGAQQDEIVRAVRSGRADVRSGSPVRVGSADGRLVLRYRS